MLSVIVKNDITNNSKLLTDHFFRNEYGRIVSVISKYVELETAEDIVQDTLLTAVEYWQHNGIPPNPEAWLYKTAKHKSLNWIRKKNNERDYLLQNNLDNLSSLEFNEYTISDEQLRVMLSCCSTSLSEEAQIALILKTLCGFSIAEIAAAFHTNTETINKRLVRGRKTLKEGGVDLNPATIHNKVDVLLKTIYLLFNEGYYPSKKELLVRKDLCLEAIRLTQIIISNKKTLFDDKVESLMALMCFNCSRFDARTSQNELIEMSEQDRSLWNQELINKGLFHLSKAQESGTVSAYMILASISAQYCIAQSHNQINWNEILKLYNTLLKIEDTPIIRLNQLVIFAKVHSTNEAIQKVLELKELNSHHLYYSTLAYMYNEVQDIENAIHNYKLAISIAANERDHEFLSKKLETLVPNSNSHV